MKGKLVFLVGGIAAILVLGGILFVSGCSGDDKGTSSEPPDTADVNAYLSALPPWPDTSPDDDLTDAPIIDFEDAILCITTPCSITRTPEKVITYGQFPNILWLGALIQGDTYMGGVGSMEELPIRQRAPLTIGLTFNIDSVSTTVHNPDATTVSSAISNLIVIAENSGFEFGSGIYFQQREMHSIEQAALSLGLSTRFWGASIKDNLDINIEKRAHTLTAYFKQVMFESYIVLPQTPAELFSTDFTQEKLDEQVALGRIGDGNLPVFVSTIQWGRMMLLTISSDSSVTDIENSLKATYGTSGVTMNSKYEHILANASLEVVTWGGSSSDAMSMIRSGNINDYFNESPSLTTAFPLSYKLCNLADNSTAKLSEMTSYDVEECMSENVNCYLNESEWRAAVAALAGDGLIIELPTTPLNITLSDEVSIPPAPNDDMGSILTFDSSNTDFPFSFFLKATVGGYNLVYDDREGGDYHSPWGIADYARSISIGDVDADENDNFEIQVIEWDQNAAVFAIGISVGDNEYSTDEYIEVNGVNSFYKKFSSTAPDCIHTHGFIGIVGTMPLTRVFFNEGNGGDDIFVRDFYFGVAEWSD